MISDNMDAYIDPCQNFYFFACGNFENRHPMKPYENRVTTKTLRMEEIRAKILSKYHYNYSWYYIMEGGRLYKFFVKIFISKQTLDRIRTYKNFMRFTSSAWMMVIFKRTRVLLKNTYA